MEEIKLRRNLFLTHKKKQQNYIKLLSNKLNEKEAFFTLRIVSFSNLNVAETVLVNYCLASGLFRKRTLKLI